MAAIDECPDRVTSGAMYKVVPWRRLRGSAMALSAQRGHSHRPEHRPAMAAGMQQLQSCYPQLLCLCHYC
jgi:hypothetical protein